MIARTITEKLSLRTTKITTIATKPKQPNNKIPGQTNKTKLPMKEGCGSKSAEGAWDVTAERRC